MAIDIERYREQGVDFSGIDNTFFIVGILNEFANRLQTKGDSFFKEISWKQCFLLICLNLMSAPPSIKELAEMVGSSHQNVKQMLLKLESAGFVKLSPDADDRRKLRIYTTEKTAQFSEKYSQPSADFMSRLFADIPSEDLDITVKTLIKMDNNLHNM